MFKDWRKYDNAYRHWVEMQKEHGKASKQARDAENEAFRIRREVFGNNAQKA